MGQQGDEEKRTREKGGRKDIRKERERVRESSLASLTPSVGQACKTKKRENGEEEKEMKERREKRTGEKNGEG